MSKGGSSGSSGSTKTSTTTTVDPDIKSAYLSNLDYARDIANQTGTRQFSGFDPYYQMGEAQIAGAAQGGVGAQNLDAASAMTGQMMNMPDMANISNFYNPFQQQVIDATMSDMERARQGAVQQIGQQANAARAFGGSRHGIADTMANQEFARNAGSTLANLRSQGFNTAANLMQQTNAQRMAAAQQLAGLGQQQTAMQYAGGQAMMGLGGTRQQFAQQQMDAARNLGLERLGIMQSALGLQMPGMGGGSTTTSPNPAMYSNPATGALGGALGAAAFTSNPYLIAGAGLLGALQ
jgi:hypothetical protein